ncbi:MAG TPA: hypothetical protein VF702_00345 [Allosphingosinicella sp.]
MVRIVLGLIAGLIGMVATVAGIELAAHLFFAVPAERGPVPLGLQLLVLAAYFCGALVGGAIALRISGVRRLVWIVAAAVIAGAIWSMFLIPHPQWMQIAAVIAPALGAVAAGRVGAARPPSGPADPA